jgi:stage II sporulation protein P
MFMHIIAILFALSGVILGIASIEGAIKEVVLASAGFALPQGDIKSNSGVTSTSSNLNSAIIANSNGIDDPQSFSRPSILSLSFQGSSSVASKVFPGIPTSALPIVEKTFAANGNPPYLSYQGITILKQTKQHTVDIKKVLAETPDVHIKSNNKPQVLIVHTHSTENYLTQDRNYYYRDEMKRSTDPNLGVMRVGDEIEKGLKEAGIGVINDKTLNDYPSYNGSYAKNVSTITADLKKYPTIQVVLDVHRDAMEEDDGTRLKPVAIVNGKKVAQIMIIAGCNEEGALPFPDWEYNLRLALRIQKDLVTVSPTFARPILFTAARYDMHLTHGSLLVEFGTDANTLDEAVAAGGIFAKSLAKTLKSLK